jgi:hypothetical protein
MGTASVLKTRQCRRDARIEAAQCRSTAAATSTPAFPLDRSNYLDDFSLYFWPLGSSK